MTPAQFLAELGTFALVIAALVMWLFVGTAMTGPLP